MSLYYHHNKYILILHLNNNYSNKLRLLLY